MRVKYPVGVCPYYLATVVCIDDSEPPRGVPADQWLVKGRHYTVRDFVRDTVFTDVYGFRFFQININHNGLNMYDARRFALADARYN